MQYALLALLLNFFIELWFLEEWTQASTPQETITR